MDTPSLRSLARPLTALTILHLTLLLTWSVMVPTFRGADEHVHHDLLRHLTDTWRYPDYDGLLVSRRTLNALGTSPVFPAHAAAAPASAAPHRADRPGWADLGPDVRNGPFDQMPQHPPLYYESTAAVLRVIDGDGTAPLDRVVWQLRLLSVLVMVPLPLLAADIARRFGASTAVTLAAAAGVLAVPQLTHVGATVNNDPLMVLLGSVTLAGAARLATGDRRWAVAAATGAAAGLALFTKGFAVPLVPAVALACLLPLWRRRSPAGTARRPTDGADAMHADPTRASGRSAEAAVGAGGMSVDPVGRSGAPPSTAGGLAAHAAAGGASDARGTLGRAALVAGLAFVLGGWWWVRNVVEYGTPQPGVRLRKRVPGVELDVLRFLGDFSERLIGSFWGWFGWREVHLPLGISIAMTVLVVAAVAVACWRRWERLVLLVPTLVAGAMVLSSGWGAFKKTGVSYATQGRYLFAGVAGLAALVALGLGRSRLGRGRWLPVGTLVVALALQGLGLWLCLGRYWAGDLVDRLRALVAFAPLPGVVTASILAATAVAAIVALAAVATRPAPSPTS